MSLDERPRALFRFLAEERVGSDLLNGVLEWMADCDTGLSSETMALCALDIDVDRWPDHPHDSGDFGRCVGLVKSVPAIREHFPKIAALSREWSAIIECWDELHDRLNRDLASAVRGRECHTRLREIIDKARKPTE